MVGLAPVARWFPFVVQPLKDQRDGCGHAEPKQAVDPQRALERHEQGVFLRRRPVPRRFGERAEPERIQQRAQRAGGRVVEQRRRDFVQHEKRDQAEIHAHQRAGAACQRVEHRGTEEEIRYDEDDVRPEVWCQARRADAFDVDLRPETAEQCAQRHRRKRKEADADGAQQMSPRAGRARGRRRQHQTFHPMAAIARCRAADEVTGKEHPDDAQHEMGQRDGVGTVDPDAAAARHLYGIRGDREYRGNEQHPAGKKMKYVQQPLFHMSNRLAAP